MPERSPLSRREFLGASSAVALLGLTRPASAAEACTASATAWPQFKGDSRRCGDNAVAKLKLPMQRVTAVRFPKPIYASPAVVDGRVYVQDAHGTVACIDSRKNSVVWHTSIGGVNNTSSPAIFDGKVYIGSTAGALVILDAENGKEIKRVAADGPVITAPAVTDRGIYFSTLNGKLVKIDPAGNVVWTFDGGKTSIVEFAVNGDRIVFFAGTDNTQQYLLRDAGAKVETLATTPSSGQTCPTSGPVLFSETDYAYQCFDSEFGTFYVGDRLLDIDAHEGRAVPSVRGNKLYRGDKCFDLDAVAAQRMKLKKHPQQGGSLLKPLWRVSNEFLYDGGFHSSPALARDVMVIGSELGGLHFFALNGNEANRKPLWSFSPWPLGQPNGGITSSPAVVDGRVFYGGEDRILYGLGDGDEAAVVDVTAPRSTPMATTVNFTGSDWPAPGGDMGSSNVARHSRVRPPFKVTWRTRVWSTFKGPMIVADRKLFAAGRGGALIALDAGTGEILWKLHHPGIESRPAPTYSDTRLFLMRSRSGQGDSPHVIGASGGPAGEGLYCHDANTGARLWHRSMPFAYHFNADGLPVADGMVFVVAADENGDLVAHGIGGLDGKDAWRTALPKLSPGRKTLVRFSGVIAGGLWCVSIRGWAKDKLGATLALDTREGKIVWRHDELVVEGRTCLAARNGVLVLFTPDGSHALDPATGKLLWKGPGKDAKVNTPVSQALTDLFLESQGKKGIVPAGSACYQPVFANGLWYTHDTREAYSANKILARNDAFKVVWEHPFLSNACPSPAPAYHHLYYSPNAEGVIYCFAPEK